MTYTIPVPKIERRDAVDLAEAETSVVEQKPLITDEHGDWFVSGIERVSQTGAIATLRLAVPPEGLRSVTKAKLEGFWRGRDVA